MVEQPSMIGRHAEAIGAVARPLCLATAFAAIAAALLASAGCAGATGGSGSCNAGCLCNLTPESCQVGSGCYPGHQILSDGGQGPFICSNGPILPPNCIVIAVPVDGGADGEVTMGCASDAGAD
jgi:hypothetical protein